MYYCGKCLSITRGRFCKQHVFVPNPPKFHRVHHCVAVCPNGALDHKLAPLEKQVLLEKTPMPNADMTARFLRSRRSIRSFQKKRVPRKTIRELLDIAQFTPTAYNSQGVSYHSVDDPVTLKELAAVIADWAGDDLKLGFYSFIIFL